MCKCSKCGEEKNENEFYVSEFKVWVCKNASVNEDEGTFKKVVSVSKECMNCISGLEGKLIKESSDFWKDKSLGIINDVVKVENLSDAEMAEVLTESWITYKTLVEKIRHKTGVFMLKTAEALLDQVLSRNGLLNTEIQGTKVFDLFCVEKTGKGSGVKNLLFRKKLNA